VLDNRRAREIIDAVALGGEYTIADLEWLEKHRPVLTSDQQIAASLVMMLRAWGGKWEETAASLPEQAEAIARESAAAERKRLIMILDELLAALSKDEDPKARDWAKKLIEGDRAERAEIESARATRDAHANEQQTEQQAVRDAAYAAELEAQQKAAPKHKAKAAAELNIALETLLEKVPNGGTAPGNGTKPTGDADHGSTSG
jgi:hypothetical protein